MAAGGRFACFGTNTASELNELAEHGSARKRRKRSTAGKYAPRSKLAGNGPLLVRLDLEHAHFHEASGFSRELGGACVEPRRAWLPGVIPAEQNDARVGLRVCSNKNCAVHQSLQNERGPRGGPTELAGNGALGSEKPPNSSAITTAPAARQ